MKYLKSYESVRRKGPIQHDVEDIFRELEDNGFNISFNFFSQGQRISILISKSSTGKFPISDIIDDVERCIRYLNDKNWELDRFRFDVDRESRSNYISGSELDTLDLSKLSEMNMMIMIFKTQTQK